LKRLNLKVGIRELSFPLMQEQTEKKPLCASHNTHLFTNTHFNTVLNYILVLITKISNFHNKIHNRHTRFTKIVTADCRSLATRYW